MSENEALQNWLITLAIAACVLVYIGVEIAINSIL